MNPIMLNKNFFYKFPLFVTWPSYTKRNQPSLIFCAAAEQVCQELGVEPVRHPTLMLKILSF